MATAVNEITGALITTKGKSTTTYADNYDRIFRNKQAEPMPETPSVTVQLKRGQHFIELPSSILDQLGWGIGTKLSATVSNGTLVLTKV